MNSSSCTLLTPHPLRYNVFLPSSFIRLLTHGELSMWSYIVNSPFSRLHTLSTHPVSYIFSHTIIQPLIHYQHTLSHTSFHIQPSYILSYTVNTPFFPLRTSIGSIATSNTSRRLSLFVINRRFIRQCTSEYFCQCNNDDESVGTARWGWITGVIWFTPEKIAPDCTTISCAWGKVWSFFVILS